MSTTETTQWPSSKYICISDTLCWWIKILWCYIWPKIFLYTPSYVGINGNEAADLKAKASPDLNILNLKVSFMDFKPFLNRYILSKRQKSWDGATDKPHEIKPVLGKNTNNRSLRRDVVLTRLRIGHTRITHFYLLKREDQPLCISYNTPFTVKHFLIDCFEFAHVWREFFHTNDNCFKMYQLITFSSIFLTKYNF